MSPGPRPVHAHFLPSHAPAHTPACALPEPGTPDGRAFLMVRPGDGFPFLYPLLPKDILTLTSNGRERSPRAQSVYVDIDMAPARLQGVEMAGRVLGEQLHTWVGPDAVVMGSEM